MVRRTVERGLDMAFNLNNVWENYFAECEVVTRNNEAAVEEKFKEVLKYADNVLSKKYSDCGVVYNRHEENLKKGGFLIWIDNGTITHKWYTLAECGIAPLQLESYPIRPDKY